MSNENDSKISRKAWYAFHDIRITLLPPLIKHMQDVCGVSEAEYQILIGINSAPNKKTTPSQLAKAIGWDIARVSHQVSRMEYKGLVNKKNSSEDARSFTLSLTNKGESLFKAAFPKQMKEVERLFGDALTTEQCKQLIEIARAIKTNVKSKTTKG